MDEFEQSDVEKRQMTLTILAIKMQYVIKKKNAFIKNCKCSLFSLVFVIKLVGSMTEIFSVELQKTDRQGHEGHTEYITM